MRAESNFTLTNGTATAFVENLRLQAGLGDINGAGNALANSLTRLLTGNSATNDLRGLDGDDRLEAGDGDHRLFGGLGAHSFRFSAANLLTATDFVGL